MGAFDKMPYDERCEVAGIDYAGISNRFPGFSKFDLKVLFQSKKGQRIGRICDFVPWKILKADEGQPSSLQKVSTVRKVHGILRLSNEDLAKVRQQIAGERKQAVAMAR